MLAIFKLYLNRLRSLLRPHPHYFQGFYYKCLILQFEREEGGRLHRIWTSRLGCRSVLKEIASPPSFTPALFSPPEHGHGHA